MGLPDQILERPEHEGERRPQLVADVGEEPALQLVELAQALVGGLELPAAPVEVVPGDEIAEPEAVADPAADDAPLKYSPTEGGQTC